MLFRPLMYSRCYTFLQGDEVAGCKVASSGVLGPEVVRLKDLELLEVKAEMEKGILEVQRETTAHMNSVMECQVRAMYAAPPPDWRPIASTFGWSLCFFLKVEPISMILAGGRMY